MNGSRMTLALRYRVFPRSVVEAITAHRPIPQSFLKPWEAARPHVLDDHAQDIFSPLNSRAFRHPNARFDLFQQVESPRESDFLVLQNWLEICEASGVREHIRTLIDATVEAANGQPVVISFNHDRDEATVPELQSLPQNVVVLSYNTSKPTRNDLVLPFWNVDCRSPHNENQNRQYKASFIGQCGGELRRRIKYAFQNRPGYYFSEDRRPEAEYLEIMRDSWFSLCPRGGGLSSYRFWESFQSEAIPVLFADDCVLPFTGRIDWRSLCVRIPERLAGDIGAIEAVIDAVDRDEMIGNCRLFRKAFSLESVQTEIYMRLRDMLHPVPAEERPNENDDCR